MPFLKIEVTNDLSDQTKQTVIDKCRQIVRDAKGDPSSLISVFVQGGISGNFGHIDSPAANVHLESFGFTESVTRELTRQLSKVLHDDLGISPDYAYIFFYNVPSPHLTSWSGQTFAELLVPHSGERFDLTRRLRGRLVNADGGGTSSEPYPIVGLTIELWKKVEYEKGEYVFQNRTVSGDGGFFEMYFPSDEKITTDSPGVFQLRIYEPDQFIIVEGTPGVRRFVAAVHPLQDTGLIDDIPLGRVSIDFYRYDPAFAFPYAIPESIRQGFSARQEAEFRKSENRATSIGQFLFASFESSPDPISIDDIQRQFGDAPTIVMERNAPGSSRNDVFFAERLLNNMAPPLFRIDSTDQVSGDDPSLYVVDYNWSRFSRRPDLTLLSFRARFRNHNGSLVPHDILVGVDNEDNPEKYEQITPGDGERWKHAKRLVRAHHNNLVGQVHFHLAQTHFNMEQYGIAFLRNVFNHPIRQLIYPFIREILAINEKGRTTLLGGPSIVFEIEPISRNSVSDWVVNALGNADWRGFKPRSPLNASHKYAICANLYWNIVSDVVDDFFQRNQSRVSDHWSEIRGFSNDLVANSVQFSGRPLESSADAGPWYCRNEIPEPGREGLPSLSPITRMDSPTSDCLDNLRQLTRYVIYFTTFVHSWTHANMLTDLGELRYSGHVRNGGLGPEEDDRLIAPIRQATFALGSTHTLGRMDCGSMLDNLEGDVPTLLIARLRERRDEFKSNGFDIQKICARLNT